MLSVRTLEIYFCRCCLRRSKYDQFILYGCVFVCVVDIDFRFSFGLDTRDRAAACGRSDIAYAVNYSNSDHIDTYRDSCGNYSCCEKEKEGNLRRALKRKDAMGRFLKKDL